MYLQRELTAAQEVRDQQITELQRQTEENVLSKQTVLEKKVVVFCQALKSSCYTRVHE
jgi:hypothetical protein